MRLLVSALYLVLVLPVAAQTVEQLKALRIMSDMFVLIKECPDLEVHQHNLGTLAISSGIHNSELGPTGAQKDVFQSVVMGAQAGRNGMPATRRCEKAMEMYGPEGTEFAGLVRRVVVATPPVAQREPAPAATSGPPRLVAGVDMELAPRKFLGQRVEMRRMRCLHADKDEFRCISTDQSTMAIFTARIEPPAMQEMVERRCGTFDEMMRPACMFTLRLTPDEYNTDTISGYKKRTVVRSSAVEIVTPPPRREKR